MIREAKVLAIMFATLACLTTASCSSDGEEESNLETPKYDSEAAKFTITDASSSYKSIELTESGNYIIVKNTAGVSSAKQSLATKRMVARIFRNPQRASATRGSVSGILYGTYTKTGEGEYNLNGIGTLKITYEDDTACSLQITDTSGNTETIQGNRESISYDSDFTRNICRTWQIDGYRFYAKYNGITMFDLSASTLNGLVDKMKEWAKANDEEYDEDDYDSPFDEDEEPYQIVFTKSGTYMVYYKDTSIAVARWSWLSETEGQIQFDWGYEWTTDDEGEAWLKLSGGKLLMTEKYSESEDGETFEKGMEYTLSEVK